MSLVGHTIARYRILEQIGSGGMGVVYKAEDTKLGRTVALKFLKADALENEEAKQRFIREARAAAALDHSNVCAMHDIDEAEGQTFLAMSYLEGETIAQKASQRPLPLDEALDYAIQAARGLQAAHGEGVVHRDIKSANLMVTRQGLVKIMDFGLAQLADQSKITKTATFLGTPAYMAPEQAQREKADRRSDIWALGVVIYEMVSGRLPFAGENEHGVLYGIVNSEPEPLTALRTGLPVELDRIVAKAMAKQPGERYQRIDDMLVDLRLLLKGLEGRTSKRVSVATATVPGSNKKILAYATAALAVVAALGFWLGGSGGNEAPPRAPVREVPLTSLPGTELESSFSPDGSQVAFSWDGENQDNFDIYVTLVDGGGMAQLTSSPALDFEPAWSPDGSIVAFLRSSSNRLQAEGIYAVSPLGGRERLLHQFDRPLNFASLSWSPDSKQLAFSGVGEVEEGVEHAAVYVLSIETSEVQALTSQSEAFGDIYPAFSPDGRNLAVMRNSATERGAIYVIPLDGGEPRQVPPSNPPRVRRDPMWSADSSEIMFLSSIAEEVGLFAALASGGEERLLTRIGDRVSYPTVSPQGNRLAYARRTPPDSDIWRFEIDPSSQADATPSKLIDSTLFDGQPRISPDGTRIAFTSGRRGSRQIWVCDQDGSNAIQLTSAGGSSRPNWSPDGRRIAFVSGSQGASHISTIVAQGGSPRPVTSGSFNVSEPSWSADGRWIYFESRGRERDIWRAPAEGGEAEQVMTQGEGRPLASADGGFLYFSAGDDNADLWRVPIVGGEGELVLAGQRADAACWDVVGDDVYYIDVVEEEQSGGRRLKRLNLETRAVTDIAPMLSGCPNVSPDGSWLLYSQFEAREADLMLLENFR